MRPPVRPGATLLELLVVLALLAAASGIALAAQAAVRDRVAARAAARELALLLGTAREVAVARGSATLLLDSAASAARLRAPGAPGAEIRLGEVHGVALAASRDSLSFDARGLGRGAANLRVVLTRGSAAETVVVSRLGRVRH